MKVKGGTRDWTWQLRIKGRVHTTWHPKYGLVSRSWPRGNPGPPSLKAQRSIDQFKQACAWMPNMIPEDVAAAYDLAENTPYLPRDLLMKAIYGRLIDAMDADGNYYTDPNSAMSTLNSWLDLISQQPGSILYRGPSVWTYLPPGANGQVLTYDEASQKPFWQDAVTPAGSKPWIMSFNQNGNLVASTSAFSFKGEIILPYEDFDIHEVFGSFNTWSAGTYQACIAGLNGGSTAPIITSTVFSDPINITTGGGSAAISIPFSSPVRVTTGNYYAMMIGRTDAGPTFALNLWAGNLFGGTIWTAPAILHYTARMATVAPAVGNTIDTQSGGIGGYVGGLHWSSP